MTVVHLVPAMEQGGVETVVCDLTRALVGAGHRSVVVSRGGRLDARIRESGGEVVTLDLKSKNPLTAVFRAWHLRCVLKRIRDGAVKGSVVVCAHSRVPAWLFVIGSRGLGLKFITFAHGANSVSFYSSVMTKGSLVLCPSQFLADYLTKNYQFDSSKIRILNPAVDVVRFDPRNLDQTFVSAQRRVWRLDGVRVLMAVGRITPLKGYDALIRDFAEGKYPYDRLVIVGGADFRHREFLERLRRLAAERKASVVFAGAQAKIPECLSLADAVVSANTNKPESFGLSVVEAYAMNKPVIAKRFGGVDEIMSAVETYRAEHPQADFREAATVLYGFGHFVAESVRIFTKAAS